MRISEELHQNLNFLSLPFDVDWEEVLLKFQMHLHCSDDLKSTFLAFPIVNFFKNEVFTSG